MSTRFQHSLETRKSFKNGFTTDPQLRAKITSIIEPFRNNLKNKLNDDDLCLRTFLKINKAVAGFLGSTEAYKEDENAFRRWMSRESPANERPPREANIIDTFTSFAEEAYILADNENPNASADAHEMWRGVKRVFYELRTKVA